MLRFKQSHETAIPNCSWFFLDSAVFLIKSNRIEVRKYRDYL